MVKIASSLTICRWLALFLVLPFKMTWAQEVASGYRFSPVPQYSIALTAAYWNPIINYIADKSGVKLGLKISRTSADTTTFVLANDVEFVFTNHLFSPEREKLGWKVFGRRQTPPVQGQIVVPADSPITDVSQLADAEVAFPGSEAFLGYKIPQAYLLSKKINVRAVFGGNQDGALAQLFSGKVKAAAGNSQLLAGYAQRESKQYRVLWSSEPFYDLALMVSPKVPEHHAKAVIDAFIGMSKDPIGKEILKVAGSTVSLPENAYFIASNGSEYANYRKFYLTAPESLR
jgi:phosphonate transport system substrate-binding protein